MSVMIAIVLVGCRAAEAGITMMAVSGRAVKTMVARMFLVVIVGPVVFRTVLVVLAVLLSGDCPGCLTYGARQKPAEQ